MPIQKVFFPNSNKQQLAGWLHTPSGNGPFPAVIRTHGYRSNKEGRTSLILAEQFKDFIYLRFDMHGHGESQGSADIDAAQCVDDMKSAITFIASHPLVDKKHIAITGSSLGGMSTILAAVDPRVTAAVPVCPVSDFNPFRKSGVIYQNLIQALGQDNLYKEAEKISCPLFIIHGDHDTVVPITQSIELIRHLKQGTLHIIPRADHMFSNEAHFQQMIKFTAEFIHERHST